MAVLPRGIEVKVGTSGTEAVIAPTHRQATLGVRRLRLPPGTLRVSNGSGTAQFLRGEDFETIRVFQSWKLHPELRRMIRFHEQRGAEIREYLG